MIILREKGESIIPGKEGVQGYSSMLVMFSLMSVMIHGIHLTIIHEDLTLHFMYFLACSVFQNINGIKIHNN